MAIYRNVQLSFWTDNKVEDDFTPEDKYFYLYLLTNPQTNICGCYEVSYSQMTRQTGYNRETIDRLFDRFENIHKVIRYNRDTKEILLINWYKYNWSKSKDTLKGVKNVAQHIKCECFKKYVLDIVDCLENDTPIRGSIDPLEASVSDTDTVNINKENKENKENKDIVNNINTVKKKNTKKKKSENDMSESTEASTLFEQLWELYPLKRGKAQVSMTTKKKLLRVGYDEMIRAMDRYKEDLRRDGWRRAQQGSTFFNSGYVDYLDENYKGGCDINDSTRGNGTAVKERDLYAEKLDRLLNG